MILAVLTLMISGALAQTQKGSSRQFYIEPLLNIDNPQSEFRVDLWTDRDDATYKIGDKVTFFFKTDKDCRVTLLNVGTDGKVQLLFPNEYHKDNQVKAGAVYTIPPQEAKFAIKAKAPAGEDTVKAIATLDKVDLIKDDDIIPVKGFIKGFSGVNKNVRTLTIELEETLRPVNPKKWAETQTMVRIVPNISK
jgi:hypothetical protein